MCVSFSLLLCISWASRFELRSQKPSPPSRGSSFVSAARQLRLITLAAEDGSGDLVDLQKLLTSPSDQRAIQVVRNLERAISEVASMTEEQKAKIKSLTQDQVPIQQRRALYNQLNRRIEHPRGLKPGSSGCAHFLKSFS